MKIPYKLTSRKLILIACIVVLANIYFILGIGNGSFNDWANFMKFLVGTYVAGNEISKAFKPKDKDSNNGKHV